MLLHQLRQGEKRQNQPLRVLLYLTTTLLLAGDIQPNPGPHLIDDGGLTPTTALNAQLNLADSAPCASGCHVGSYGGHHQMRGVGGGGEGADMSIPSLLQVQSALNLVHGSGASVAVCNGGRLLCLQTAVATLGVAHSSPLEEPGVQAALSTTAAVEVISAGKGVGRLSPQSTGGCGNSIETSAAEAEVIDGMGVGHPSPQLAGGGGVPVTLMTEVIASMRHVSIQTSGGGGGGAGSELLHQNLDMYYESGGQAHI
ncbi:Hypothetical predicted protein [Xyrichtys novacula]|uniref:Uncharacterized protein n=1 Tax=Xyrichtys novacula TaxID=13765 RepID=A0AAV1GA53_XYRNO|nr:Hypothetical predicted protein [Xyrichtys novacula]